MRMKRPDVFLGGTLVQHAIAIDIKHQVISCKSSRGKKLIYRKLLCFFISYKFLFWGYLQIHL